MRPAAIQAAIFLSAAACHCGAAVPVPDGNPRAAVWKDQRVEFSYVGRTSRYSCSGLRDKVRAMLIDLGVRRDLNVVAVGCAGGGRAASSPAALRLQIDFSSPALSDRAAKPLREGDPAAVDARFQAFRIASDAFRNMGIGDCELVQQFAQQLLPKLTVRRVRRDVLCVPYRPGASRFLVRGEILKALPPEEQRALRSEAGR